MFKINDVNDEGCNGRPTVVIDELVMKDDQDIRESRRLIDVIFLLSFFQLSRLSYIFEALVRNTALRT